MKPARPPVLLFPLALAIGLRPLLAQIQSATKSAPPATRAEADRHYAEKSYVPAFPDRPFGL